MNERSLSMLGGIDYFDIPLGAHLSARRTGYLHHGVYVGNGEVIHFRRPFLKQPQGRVVLTEFEEFSRGHLVCIENACSAVQSGTEVVTRARSRLGESGYSLIRNNCEHFSNWCVNGVARSRQIEEIPAVAGELITRMKQHLMLHVNHIGHCLMLLWSMV